MVEAMSGTDKTGPKPPAPLRPKITIRFAPKPKVEESSAASLTVIPSDGATKAEDKSAALSFAAVPKRQGMFLGAATTTGLAAPGKAAAKPSLSRAERLARPLAENSDNEEEEEENTRRAAEEEAPAPPPPKTKPTVVAPPPKKEVVLPALENQFMGLAAKPAKKSYAFEAVKRRLTEETVTTLIELGKQLEELELGGLNLQEGTGITAEAEKVGDKTKFVFDNEQQFAEPLTDAKLTALDDFFRTLQLRMNSLTGKGTLEGEGTPPLSQDRTLLFKLISYAPNYARNKPKFAEQERLEAIKDMMTESIVKTLLDLETNLNELKEGGVDLRDMKVTVPDSEDKPYIYEFDDGNTFLVVEEEGSAEAAEARLKELWPLFPGGSKITLTKLIGFGAFDEEGTRLQSDLQLLTELFSLAKQEKIEKRLVKEVAKEVKEAEDAKVTKSLEGTPYESLAEPIQEEMSKAPYEITTDSDYTPGKYKDRAGRDAILPKQEGFIPSTRRAFGYFILDKFRRYMLEPLDKLDPNACKAFGDSASETQIYQYQKFVRDYISFMTPYRGVLVYHGLGSGKTCTAIAASEALLASGGKQRIIVMTPFSLRKNFIQQITFCGFRHFRLLNYWTPHEYKASDGKNALWLFATSVLRIPETYLMPKRGKSMRIWIPDLNKPQSEENYTDLGKTDSKAQQEIRDQIYETLVYDPDKKKNGLIWFLNYNGISASKLRDLACKSTYDVFDNSVIVIDEIHNLVRLMQGTIDPYLKKIAEGEKRAQTTKQAKFLDPDRFTSSAWHPKYCGRTMNYKRGYLFYRLLVGAKNTKIVGLSGTPLINFPEELGILANVLHGYNFIYKATMQKLKETNGDKRLVDGLTKMAEGMDSTNFCPYIDFHETIINDSLARIDFTFTFLPEGYRKIQGQLGVERIPFTETLPTTEEKLASVKECITKVMKGINPIYAYTSPITESAEPLLPVLGEPTFADNPNEDDSFKGRFVSSDDGTTIINGQVLFKRLSGLVSYYKGSRKDLMPEVKEGDDVIVKVPMSLDQQKKYNAIRLSEIEIEKKKEQQRRAGGVAKGDDAEVQKLASSQNYRMASRQACNFVFPDGFTRPRPLTAEQAKQADELGGALDDLVGEDQAPEASALVRTREEEAAMSEEERRQAEEARQDDEAVSAQEEAAEIAAKRAELQGKGKAEGEIQLAIKEIQERYKQEREGEVVLASAEEEEKPSAGLTAEQKRCLANMLDGESYQAALNRAKQCLLEQGAANLLVKDPSEPSRSPLARWSPKYKAILENIEALPGSSLVYSQFLGMEGIGIFTIVMRANGYVPIQVVSRGGEFEFDEETLKSIQKGPAANENRFILFTGGEDENIRKTNIDIFNAKYSELPTKIKEALLTNGFTEEVGNKRGQLCRVFCITAAGAEGLSLKNVRGVHIMEPYWNDVRMAQVKGRAIRICSHQELPLSERNVKIYTYVTIYSREAQEARGDPREGERQKWAIPREIWNRDGINRATAESYGIVTTRDDYALTSDERLYYISEKKKKLVDNLIILMKSAAADCTLNYKQNMDGTFICRMLGNEGDFLYHPSLIRDFELNKRDEMGDLFTVPAAEKAKVQAALAKLSFDEAKEEEEEEEEEEKEAPKPKAKEAAVEEAKVEEAAPEAPKPKPKPAAPAPKRISYPIAARGKNGKPVEYVVSAMPTVNPDGSLTVAKFDVFKKEDTSFKTPVGTAAAEFTAGKWLPKKGTVKINP